MSNIEKHNNGGVPAKRQDFDGLYRVAEVLSRSDLVPRAYRNKPENILLASLLGEPHGWNPVESVNNFHVIEGTPSLKPQMMMALVRKAGHSVDVKEASPEKVTLVGRRRDTGDTATVTYDINDAKRANLVGKGNWKTYPEDMLMARAVSRLSRRLFQDVVLSAGYVPEELGAEVTVTATGDQEVIDIVPAGAAKRALVAAADGDVDVAKAVWGERGTSSVTQEELDTLIAGIRTAIDEVVDAEIVEDEPAGDPVFDNPDWNETDPDGGEGVAA